MKLETYSWVVWNPFQNGPPVVYGVGKGCIGCCLCIADAETICADDICCIDCKAFSLWAWSRYEAGELFPGTWNAKKPMFIMCDYILRWGYNKCFSINCYILVLCIIRTLSFAWISLSFLRAKTCIWEDTCFLVRVFPVRSFMYRAINSFRPER